MRLLKLLLALALVWLTAVFVPRLWAAHWRFTAVAIVLLAADALFLMWWHSAMKPNRGRGAATGGPRGGE